VVRSRGVQPPNKINKLDFPTAQNYGKSPLWRQTTIPVFSQPETSWRPIGDAAATVVVAIADSNAGARQ
jgi:hypothetical protein